MRVAVVAEWYPSRGDPVLGIWAHRQALAARDAGAEVRVLALRRPVPPLSVARRLLHVPPAIGPLSRWIAGARTSLQADDRSTGSTVVPVPFVAPPRPISYGGWGYWMSPPLGRALDRLYAEWPFDVVHAHCLAPAGHAAARWVRRRGSSAFVVSAHGPDMIHVPVRSSIGRRACVAALSAADLVMANSSWALRRCEEIAGRPLPARVVHLGADVTAAEAAPRPCERRAPVGHGGAPGRAQASRGRAAGDGADTGRASAGVPRDRRRAVPRAARAPGRELEVSDRVRFLGQLPNPDAVARAADCDLFVMPGVEEPFGVAFVEAMAAGLPAIGSRGEGGPEDIAAAGGGMLLVRPGDAGELAAEIARLSDDRGELARLGAQARRTVAASFTWERCGAQTVAAYRTALASRRERT